LPRKVNCFNRQGNLAIFIMEINTGMDKKLYKWGFVVYLGLLILSVIYYKERIINLDAALYLFNIARTGTFSIEHFRYIAVVTEVFPVLAVKLSLPLDAVMLSYSVGFILYYFVCYLLCGLVFRNYRLGLALLLYHILFTSYTFYWSLSEFIQGVSLMFPVLAYIYGKSIQDLKFFPALFLVIAVSMLAFAHPLLLFPLSFSLGFLFFDTRLKRVRTLLVSVGVLFLGVLVIKTFGFKEAYDSSAMHGLSNLVKLFPDYFDTHTNAVFLANLFKIYYWIPIVFILVVVTYFRQKAWLKLLLVCAYVLGFTFLINTSYPDEYTKAFYIENLYLPIGVFLAIPLVFDVSRDMRWKPMPALLFSLIVITGFVRMYMFHQVFTDRLNWERDFLASHPNQKLMIDAKKLNTEKLLMHWGTPYEFWLLSTTELGKTASVIIHEDLNAVKWDMIDKDVLITNWGIYAYADLNRRYFILNDTNTLYTVIE
jgi:hypothetical protein